MVKITTKAWQMEQHATLKTWMVYAPHAYVDGMSEMVAFGIEDEDDARVVTAAREMLAVLAEHHELTNDGREHDPHCPCLICRTRAVLTKATGDEW